MKKSYFYTVVIIEAIVIGLCTFLVCDHFMAKDETIITPVNPVDPSPNPDPFTILDLESGIKEIEEFNTAKYYFSSQESYAKAKTFKEVFGIFGDTEIPGTSAGFTYEYKGYVNAGVDFSKASVKKDGKKISINLPKAEIMGDVGFDTMPRLLDEKKNIFNPLSSEETTKAHENLKQHEKQKAIDSGILITAEENAKKVIETYLNVFKTALKDYDISITFGNN